MQDSERVLITGGAGFIGSHLVDRALQRKVPVLVLDDGSVGDLASLASHGDGVRVVRGDILDAALLQRVLADFQPTLLYHLAAIHHIPTCEANRPAALRVNVEGTQRVLDAALAAGVGHFVFASTGGVYADSEQPMAEDHAVAPRDTYTISKVAGEALVRAAMEREGRRFTVARLFNVVGPRETNPHLLPDIVAQLREAMSTIELGNLESRRSYIHVADVADALVDLADRGGERGDVFNIGVAEELSVRQVMELFSRALGRSLDIRQVAERVRLADRPSQRAANDKLRAATGWQARHGVEEAIAEMLAEAGCE
ncbi:MAG: NAD(P)-dependent oxidoreductase [Gammaproteobacteria bacterium]|jgi:UDP-glucose 4-epimerase|nr:NAD(P)-dependent oxidoreductase [Gammaproteobacteria bacterium]